MSLDSNIKPKSWFKLLSQSVLEPCKKSGQIQNFLNNYTTITNKLFSLESPTNSMFYQQPKLTFELLHLNSFFMQMLLHPASLSSQIPIHQRWLSVKSYFILIYPLYLIL